MKLIYYALIFCLVFIVNSYSTIIDAENNSYNEDVVITNAVEESIINSNYTEIKTNTPSADDLFTLEYEIINNSIFAAGDTVKYKVILTNINNTDLYSVGMRDGWCTLTIPSNFDGCLNRGETYIYYGEFTLTDDAIKDSVNNTLINSCKAYVSNYTKTASMTINVTNKQPKVDNQKSSVITYTDWFVDYNTYMVGADGHTITKAHRDDERQPTYAEVVKFLKYDKTDSNQYVPGKYVCIDFAEDLQHNAVKAGYKCGYVSITFTDGIGHACNVFDTKDRGIIYIDCTGSLGSGPKNNDCIVDIEQNEQYKPEYLFTTNYETESMGKVRSFGVFL